MRLIPPEGTPSAEVEQAPMLLSWSTEIGSRLYDGHNGEYRLHFPCITGLRSRGDIPEFVAKRLASDLGEEWTVDNRGSRIEISHVPIGPSNHDLMMEVTTRLLEQVVLPRFGTSN